MNAIKGIIKDGRLELEIQPDWPDGTHVLIEPAPAQSEKIGLDESEWCDDAAALADWEAWIKTIEPFEFTPEEVVRISDFEDQMRRCNLEAVRRQMQDGADR
jgi:hypothetical protein